MTRPTEVFFEKNRIVLQEYRGILYGGFKDRGFRYSECEWFRKPR